MRPSKDLLEATNGLKFSAVLADPLGNLITDMEREHWNIKGCLDTQQWL